MNTYNVEGLFQIRSATPAEWEDITVEGKGGRRILEKGEMAWETGTSNFKIGDGVSEYRNLEYIKPIPPSSPYALRLGDENASYSYQEIQTILDNISGGGTGTLVQDVETLKEDVSQLKIDVDSSKQLYFANRLSFPSIGKQGPLYIAKDTGDIYYFNIDQLDGEPIGYVKLTNSFDRIICEL